MVPLYRVLGGDRKEYGPVSAEEVRRWLAEGRLNGQSLVKAEGVADWRPLATVPELLENPDQASGNPPLISATQRVAAGAPGAEILSGQPQLDIGRCLARSGALLRDNFGLFAGAAAIVWLFGLSEFIPRIGTLVGLAYRVFAGVLYGGLYLVFLKRIRGEAASVADTFAGFGDNLGQLALAGFLSWLLSELGILFCLLPGIYLMVAWVFCVPLVADKRLEFWSAMELSRKVVTRVWFPMFGLLLLAFAPVVLVSLIIWVKSTAMALDLTHLFLAGGIPTITRMMELAQQAEVAIFPFMLVTKFVLLLNLPFAAGAMMYAYEDLLGARTARAA
jgi:hypothetical protein